MILPLQLSIFPCQSLRVHRLQPTIKCFRHTYFLLGKYEE